MAEGIWRFYVHNKVSYWRKSEKKSMIVNIDVTFASIVLRKTIQSEVKWFEGILMTNLKLFRRRNICQRHRMLDFNMQFLMLCIMYSITHQVQRRFCSISRCFRKVSTCILQVWRCKFTISDNLMIVWNSYWLISFNSCKHLMKRERPTFSELFYWE